MTNTVGHRFFGLACVLAFAAVAMRVQASATSSVPTPSLDRLVVADAEVVGDDRLDVDTERVLQADRYLLRRYQSGELPLDVFVAFYASQQSGHTIHSPLNCLPGTGWTWTSLERERIGTIGGRSITVNRNVASRAGDNLLVYYWYQSRGRVTASDYRNKFLLIRDAMLLHRSDGALVRVTTPWPLARGESEKSTSFVAALYSALSAHLPE